MLARLKRRADAAEGFTLVELLVVMIIIAILMAVAIPIFLGQKNKAVGTKTKANVGTASTTMDSCGGGQTTGAYWSAATPTTCNAASLINEESSLRGVLMDGTSVAPCNVASPASPGTTAAVATPAAPATLPAGCVALMTFDDSTYAFMGRTDSTSGGVTGYFYWAKTANNGTVKTCFVGGTAANLAKAGKQICGNSAAISAATAVAW